MLNITPKITNGKQNNGKVHSDIITKKQLPTYNEPIIDVPVIVDDPLDLKEKSPVLMQALSWIVDIDLLALKNSIREEREKHTKATNEELIDNCFSKAKWKATATGFITGLPSNLLYAMPAASADVATTLKIEAYAVARAALIVDEDFFDDENAQWELLIPILGLNIGSQFLRELGVKGSMEVTRLAIKKYLSKETLRLLKKIMLKYFGIKVTQKGILTKTVPIVGGIIGGTWNYIEVQGVKKRTKIYLSKRDIEINS